jgi:type III secretory pathway lipoprotein EscJ
LFANDKRATLDQVIEACIKEMSGFIEENLDLEIIRAKDKSAITNHVKGLIEKAIDQNPARYVEIIKMLLADDIMYRLVARSYFD